MKKLKSKQVSPWDGSRLLLLLIFLSGTASGQQPANDSLLQAATVDQVIQYALKHQPQVQQSLIDEEITNSTIRSKLADWYPQINFNYNLQHNFRVQSAVIGGNVVKLGVNNTSSFQFNLSQHLFDRDALLASRTASDVRQTARLQNENARISAAAAAAKAYYDVLITKQQIKVSDEDIARLEKSLADAQSRYQAGITDQTDYKRAQIALNNARALRAGSLELLSAKIENLKSLIGYPPDAPIDLASDSLAMESAAVMDTLQNIDYNLRPEYRLLETEKRLYQANIKYNKWSFLPSVSAVGAYNFNYQNNEFSKLYQTNYPNSYAGLLFSLPLLQGGKRKANIQQSEWQLKRLDWDLQSLQSNIHSEYQKALSAYKSYLITYQSIKENLDLASQVYEVIRLQYQAGVKTYLEVISAETDLRTARINYFNTLFELLASKIDVQRSLGQLQY